MEEVTWTSSGITWAQEWLYNHITTQYLTRFKGIQQDEGSALNVFRSGLGKGSSWKSFLSVKIVKGSSRITSGVINYDPCTVEISKIYKYSTFKFTKLMNLRQSRVFSRVFTSPEVLGWPEWTMLSARCSHRRFCFSSLYSVAPSVILGSSASFVYRHLKFLYGVDFDYGYNMKVHVLIGKIMVDNPCRLNTSNLLLSSLAIYAKKLDSSYRQAVSLSDHRSLSSLFFNFETGVFDGIGSWVVV